MFIKLNNQVKEISEDKFSELLPSEDNIEEIFLHLTRNNIISSCLLLGQIAAYNSLKKTVVFYSSNDKDIVSDSWFALEGAITVKVKNDFVLTEEQITKKNYFATITENQKKYLNALLKEPHLKKYKRIFPKVPSLTKGEAFKLIQFCIDDNRDYDKLRKILMHRYKNSAYASSIDIIEILEELEKEHHKHLLPKFKKQAQVNLVKEDAEAVLAILRIKKDVSKQLFELLIGGN